DPSDLRVPPGLDEHLAHCPECREQWQAHREMLRLKDDEHPQLSPGFNARLRRRLEAESASVSAPRRWPWLALGLYATAAAALSLVILARLDWSWVPALDPAERVLGVLGLLAFPIVGLFDLS